MTGTLWVASFRSEKEKLSPRAWVEPKGAYEQAVVGVSPELVPQDGWSLSQVQALTAMWA